jgi:glucose-1-phosphate thymidylyltransferase
MAGRASRLARLPFSKELYPTEREVDGQARPVPVSWHLLEQLRVAGARRAYLVLRQGKWDIPGYYRDGASTVGLPMAYLVAQAPHGVPFTLDTAAPFVADAVVATGFPDILLSPPDALRRVVSRLVETESDVSLGLFPWHDPTTDDMVRTDHDGRVVGYHRKEALPDLRYTWSLAAWGPRFTALLHESVAAWAPGLGGAEAEMAIGLVLQAALDAGLVVQSVTFDDGRMLDIGSPAGLQALPSFLRELS